MSRWEVATVLLMILVLAAILLPAILSARRAAMKTNQANHLRQVAVGLANFDDTYRHLPPATRTDEDGRPLSSWRFQILPFLEAIMLGIDLDERWDSPVNRWFSSLGWPTYCWASGKGPANRCQTNVVAITGPGTAFEDDRILRFKDLGDNTIVVIELARTDAHWMEPGDLSVDDVPPSIVQGVEGDGVHVLFADGQVWFLRRDVPLDDLRKFFTINGAKRYDREQLLGAYADGRWGVKP
jgi:hypothetical protein